MSQKKKVRYSGLFGRNRLPPYQMVEENDQLEVYLGFDQIDLQTNRDGNITDLQLRRLGERWWNKFWALVFGVPLWAGFIGAVIIPRLMRESYGLACTILLGLYAAAYLYCEIRDLALLAWDIRQHQIYWVIGEAKLDVKFVQFSKETLRVGGVRFPVNWAVFRVERSYTIYYAPHSKTILSAEISRPEDFEARLEQSVVTMGADGEIEVG